MTFFDIENYKLVNDSLPSYSLYKDGYLVSKGSENLFLSSIEDIENFLILV